MLLPGAASVLAKPLVTGSPPRPVRIGIVVVALCSAWVAGVPRVRIASGFDRTMAAASADRRAASLFAWFHRTTRFVPSIHPHFGERLAHLGAKKLPDLGVIEQQDFEAAGPVARRRGGLTSRRGEDVQPGSALQE